MAGSTSADTFQTRSQSKADLVEFLYKEPYAKLITGGSSFTPYLDERNSVGLLRSSEKINGFVRLQKAQSSSTISADSLDVWKLNEVVKDRQRQNLISIRSQVGVRLSGRYQS